MIEANELTERCGDQTLAGQGRDGPVDRGAEYVPVPVLAAAVVVLRRLDA